MKQVDNSDLTKAIKYRTEKEMKKINEDIRMAMIEEKATAKKLCSLAPIYSAYGVNVKYSISSLFII